MANINNSQLSKELIDGAKIQTSFDKIPTQLADKVVPVMEVNPKMLRRCNLVKSQFASNSTSGTIFATPTDKDTFIVACCLSVIKDVTSTSAFSTITATIDGVAIDLLSIAGLTLTAQSESVAVSFPFPVKIDRGTNIIVTNSTNVANIRSRGNIIGYYDNLS